MEWQPIETAPKDGTPVLVYNGEGDNYRTEKGQIGVAACFGGYERFGIKNAVVGNRLLRPSYELYAHPLDAVA